MPVGLAVIDAFHFRQARDDKRDDREKNEDGGKL